MIEEKNDFERDLENAILVYPTSYQGRWVTGNLLLQEGALEKALPHFSYILKHYPEQSNLVYDVWLKVVNDPDFILERLVPKEPASLNRYLSYLYETGDNESAKKVWGKKKVSWAIRLSEVKPFGTSNFSSLRVNPTRHLRSGRRDFKKKGCPFPQMET